MRSPRRRPPAGFRSARTRAPSRLFFVATRVAARGRAAPPTTVAAPSAERDSVIARRRHLRAAHGFAPGSATTPSALGRRRTRGHTRDASRAGFSRSRATTAARDGGPGAAHPRARGGVSSRPRPRRRVPRARGAAGPRTRGANTPCASSEFSSSSGVAPLPGSMTGAGAPPLSPRSILSPPGPLADLFRSLSLAPSGQQGGCPSAGPLRRQEGCHRQELRRGHLLPPPGTRSCAVSPPTPVR